MNSTITPRTRFYTPAEANRMLRYVGAILSDIVELYADVHERRARLARIRQQRRKSKDGDPWEEELRESEANLETDIVKLEEYVDELRVLGLELADPVKGAVDFPSQIEDVDETREVRLSWMLGEPTVAHWHEVDDSYGERRELDERFPTDEVDEIGNADSIEH